MSFDLENSYVQGTFNFPVCDILNIHMCIRPAFFLNMVYEPKGVYNHGEERQITNKTVENRRKKIKNPSFPQTEGENTPSQAKILKKHPITRKQMKMSILVFYLNQNLIFFGGRRVRNPSFKKMNTITPKKAIKIEMLDNLFHVFLIMLPTKRYYIANCVSYYYVVN